MKPKRRQEDLFLLNHRGAHASSPNHQAAIRLFQFTVAGIILAEIIVAIAIYYLQPLTAVQILAVNILIVTLLVFPTLYFFAFRPLLRHTTELEQVEKRRVQEAELRQRFFHSSSMLIAYMDRDFNFIEVNEAYARAEAKPPEFFKGKNHFNLYPHAENEAIFRRVVETGEPYTVFDKPFVYATHPDLGVTYWNWDLQPVRDPQGQVIGVVLSLLDVTERKRAQLQVELERTRLKSILDTTPNGVYIVNQDFEMEYANPAIEREFGPVEPGEKCYHYFKGLARGCPSCAYAADMTQKIGRQEWTSEQTGRTYEIYDTPLHNADGSISKLNILHDITESKRAEQELEKRNQALQLLSSMEHRQREISDTLRAAVNNLARSLDMHTILITLLRYARALTRADAAGIFFLDDETHLKLQAFETDPDTAAGFRFPDAVDSTQNPIVARLVACRQSVVVEDTQQEPGWVVHAGAELARSVLAAPILVEEKLIGIIGLASVRPCFFSEEHAQWVEVLAGHTAAAIQNAWLFDQVQTGRERLQILSRRLVEFQELERRHIAFELHDQAAQVLTSLLLGLAALEKSAPDPQSVQSQVVEMKRMVNEVLEDIHRLAVNLRPAGLDHLGLVAAIEQLVKSYGQNTHLSIRLKTIGLPEDERLSQEMETNLYRIAQEALTNVVRHAQAANVDIIIERRDGWMRIIVEDDGQGFDANVSAARENLGLFSMQERTEMLNGRLTLESAPGCGTTLLVEVPL